MSEMCTALFALLFINLIVICIPAIILKCSKHNNEKSAIKELLKSRLPSLLTVKSIITLITTEVFAYLAIIDKLKDNNHFMTVYSVIIAFYFGTQMQKNQNTTDSANTEEKEQ